MINWPTPELPALPCFLNGVYSDISHAKVSVMDRGFSFGDHPSLADCHLVPQVYAANRFGVNMSPFPAIRAVVDAMYALPAVIDAHPDQQPDADPVASR